MSEKRAMIFIDAQNLLYGAKRYDDDLDIDFLRLADVLSDGYDLIRSYHFDSFNPEQNNKEGFFTFLETNGFRVEAKPFRKRDDGYVEKGADIGLATELIASGFNDSYDVGIVVTGDDDFSKAIKYVQDRGKIVVVASFESHASSGLKRRADEFVRLDEHADEIQR